ncbi:hypothetical protein FC093_18840 [Ilyomonas limi]|uniref:Beta-hexosaminidase bacterial type N-terminal domain-containing protein n=1 Tax=Ilyomonas limi TaxID=2575867 RepID=A0A4U3KVJ5_9BACT|nr:hypothetical protein FC093_18840 [Ilyomonas limi]
MIICILFFVESTNAGVERQDYTIYAQEGQSKRILYGISKLQASLSNTNNNSKLVYQYQSVPTTNAIIVGLISEPLIQSAITKLQLPIDSIPGKEGFIIRSVNNNIIITGSDASGVMYGCFELADSIKLNGKVPASIHIKDKPQMVMRGVCVGLQKPYYLPGRTVYEYPYTEQTFPWFYNKKLWIKYLDSLAEYRINSLYLWNGHPFASLVKLKEYPFAVEVDDATFKKNEDIYRFLTKEADKRGIWIIQMFYNIIVSKPFAEHYGIKTQDRERHIVPLIADYTRKSIAAFIAKYPNVGLLFTLGEAMEGAGQEDIDWFTKTIIPGVKDGLRAANIKTEPPIILRAHDTDAPDDIKAAKGLYSNLYTMAKFNGEALTTYEPRGSWAELHRTLSRLGSVQIENVHILANLEPFRYAADDFIQKCVQGMHKIYEANGVHVYPQASYWDWPYAADSTEPLLLQIDRDWLWYKEWARYSWNCNRNREGEVKYWSHQIALRLGCDDAPATDILMAYEKAGEIAPKLLRRFGITDGNRQTLTLGMRMAQLVNPERFNLFTLLYTSESPEGETLSEYAQKEWNHQPHVGETPVDIINQVKAEGDSAVAAVEKAAPYIVVDKEEFNRIKNDMYCYRALAYHYAYKAEAALHVLRYKYSDDIKDLDSALLPLQKSVEWYTTLTRLTDSTYRYANSMQTAQRKIPFRGVNATYKKWSEILPEFKKEVAAFQYHIDSMKANAGKGNTALEPLQPAKVTINSNVQYYPFTAGAKPFLHAANTISDVVPELQHLKGIVVDTLAQQQQETLLQFKNEEPVKLLVGYFVSKDSSYLQEPQLETNATANDRGQGEVIIGNALVIKQMPPVNIHTYLFERGNNKLVLPKGKVLLLGFIKGDEPIKTYDAGLTPGGKVKQVDWLFER